MQTPTICRIVKYILDEDDVVFINRRREDARGHMRTHESVKDGTQLHRGNECFAGDEYPAMIVRVLANGSVNLVVTLDGEDVYWATARKEGGEPASWHWPNVDPKGRTDAEKSIGSGKGIG